MRTNFFHTKQAVLILGFALAVFTGTPAGAQTAQVPPAPAGGLNPSKLPDVMGIHMGMPVQQAVALVKSEWPADQVKIFYTKFAKSSDPAWISHVSARRPGTGNNQGNSVDDITVFFNAPPNPQVVVQISRTVMMIPPTARGNLLAALRQKYGPEMKPPLSFDNMAWEFNEEGQPVPLPGTYICTTFNQPTEGQEANSKPAEIFVFPSPQPIDTQIPRLVNMCKDAITVTTLTYPKGDPNQLLSSSTVIMIDHAEDLRDFVATSRYAEALATSGAAKQLQQQLKNAQPAPKL